MSKMKEAYIDILNAKNDTVKRHKREQEDQRFRKEKYIQEKEDKQNITRALGAALVVTILYIIYDVYLFLT